MLRFDFKCIDIIERLRVPSVAWVSQKGNGKGARGFLTRSKNLQGNFEISKFPNGGKNVSDTIIRPIHFLS